MEGITCEFITSFPPFPLTLHSPTARPIQTRQGIRTPPNVPNGPNNPIPPLRPPFTHPIIHPPIPISPNLHDPPSSLLHRPRRTTHRRAYPTPYTKGYPFPWWRGGKGWDPGIRVVDCGIDEAVHGGLVSGRVSGGSGGKGWWESCRGRGMRVGG
jgi:hypothetical protein